MAGNILWMSGTAQTVAVQASGQGQQLNNGSAVACTTTFDNTGASGGPGFFALAELVLAQSGLAAGVIPGNTIDFHLVPSRDDVNFADANVAANPVLPGNHYRGSFITTVSGNSRMRLMIEGIPILPIQYKAYIKNNTGQNMTSGWSLFLDVYQDAYT